MLSIKDMSKKNKILAIGTLIVLIMSLTCYVFLNFINKDDKKVMDVEVLDISSHSEKDFITNDIDGNNTTTDKLVMIGKESDKTYALAQIDGIKYINSENKVKLLLKGTDDNYASNNLKEENIVVKVGGTTITPKTKTLGTATAITNGVQYELTLGGLTGNGELEVEIDANTLEDKSTNKNILTKFNTTIIVDNTAPTITANNITYGENLSITLEDTSSKVVAWAVTEDNTTPTSQWEKIDAVNNTTVTKSGLTVGTYYIWAKDSVGNINSKSVTVESKPMDSSSITVILNPTTYTYDGTEKEPDVTVKDVAITLTSGTDYTFTYSDNINAGTGKVTITGQGNYTGTRVETFKINPKPVQVEGQDYNGKYDGEGYSITLNVTEPVEETTIYYAKETLNSTNYQTVGSTINVEITEAGTSTIYWYVHTTNTNYSDVAGNNKVILVPKEVQVVASDFEGIYDGNGHTISVDVLEPTTGTTIYYSDSTQLTQDNYTDSTISTTTPPAISEAGTNTIYWYVHSNDTNYSDIAGSNRVIIEKKAIEIPTANTGLIYNGTEQRGIPEGDFYTVKTNATATDAGEYTATVGLNTKQNTTWSDGTTDDKTIKWSIAKATPTLTLENETFSVAQGSTITNNVTYNGDGNLTVSSSDESSATSSINNKIVTVNVVKYNFSAIIITVLASEGNNYESTTATFTIEIIDDTLPTITLEPNSQDTYIKDGIAVTVKATDTQSGIDANSTMEYAWSQSNTELPTAYNQLPSTSSTDSETTWLIPEEQSNAFSGTYYLWIKEGSITDRAGNGNETKISDAFLFDNTAPNKGPNIVVSPSVSSGTTAYHVEGAENSTEGSYQLRANVGYNWLLKISGGEDEHSGVAGFAYSTSIDGEKTEYTSYVVVSCDITEDITYYFFTKDNVGLYSDVYTAITMKAEKNVPTISVNSNTTWARGHTWTVTISDETSGLTAGTYKFKWALATTEPDWSTVTSEASITISTDGTTSGTWSYGMGGTQTGKYYLYVYTTTVIKNVAGGTTPIGTKANGLFYFDNTAPKISVDSDTTYAKSQTATITLEDTGSGLAEGTYQIKYVWTLGSIPTTSDGWTSMENAGATINTATITVSTSGTNSVKKTLTKSSGTGQYNIGILTVSAIKDVVGNTLSAETIISGKQYLDNTAPVLSEWTKAVSTSKPSAYENTTYDVTLTITENDSGMLGYYITGDTSSTTVPSNWITHTSYTLKLTIPCGQTLRIWLKDKAGNTSYKDFTLDPVALSVEDDCYILYPKLQKAVSDTTNSGQLELLKSTSEQIKNTRSEVTINLNDCTITYASSADTTDSSGAILTNTGELALSNGSFFSGQANMAIYNTGTLTGYDIGSNYRGRAIHNVGGNVMMTSATFASIDDDTIYSNNGTIYLNSCTVRLNGGGNDTIYGTGSSTINVNACTISASMNQRAINVDGTSNLNIAKGTTITNSNGVSDRSYALVRNSGDGTITISDSTLTDTTGRGAVYISNNGTSSEGQGKLVVNSGSVLTSSNAVGIWMESSASPGVTINGGTVKSTCNAAITCQNIMSDGTININGGTVFSTSTLAISSAYPKMKVNVGNSASTTISTTTPTVVSTASYAIGSTNAMSKVTLWNGRLIGKCSKTLAVNDNISLYNRSGYSIKKDVTTSYNGVSGLRVNYLYK